MITPPSSHVALILALFALPATLAGQPPIIKPFGKRCDPTIQIRYQGSPALGKTFAIEYVGPHDRVGSRYLNFHIALPVLILGGSNKSGHGVPLPWRLPDVWGSGGYYQNSCFLYVSPDLLVPMPLATASKYQTSVRGVIPNDPGLIGAKIFAQWAVATDNGGYVMCYDPKIGNYMCWIGWGGILSSDALEITIGK